MEPYAIFPDDLDDDYLPAASAAMQAMAERTSYMKKCRRDYSVALSMVAPQNASPAYSVENKVENKLPDAIPQPPAAFIPNGVKGTVAPTLDTSGVSSFLSGQAPDGAHVFELSFNQELLGGVRCSLAALNGVVTATFHASTYEAAQKLQERLPQLRQMLQAKGLKIDRLDVQVS